MVRREEVGDTAAKQVGAQGPDQSVAGDSPRSSNAKSLRRLWFAEEAGRISAVGQT